MKPTIIFAIRMFSLMSSALILSFFTYVGFFMTLENMKNFIATVILALTTFGCFFSVIYEIITIFKRRKS